MITAYSCFDMKENANLPIIHGKLAVRSCSEKRERGYFRNYKLLAPNFDVSGMGSGDFIMWESRLGGMSLRSMWESRLGGMSLRSMWEYRSGGMSLRSM